jgi:hypothetical protein
MAAAQQPQEYMGPEPDKQEKEKARKQIKATPRTVEDWIEVKKQFPSLATVSRQGDLVSYPIRDTETVQIISLRGWKRKTPQEIVQAFVDRRESPEANAAADAFAEAKRELREVFEAYKNGAAAVEDVVAANHRVHEADCIRNTFTKTPRNFEAQAGVIGRDLNFNLHDTFKVKAPVYVLESTSFPLTEQYNPVPVETSPRVTARALTAVEAEVAAGGGGGGAAQQFGGSLESQSPNRKYTQAEGARIGAIRAARAKQQAGFVHKMA